MSRAQLEELASTIPNFHFVSLSDPNPLKKFHRIAFIILTPDAPAVDNDTVALLNEKKIHSETHGDFTCHVGIHTGNRELKKKVLNEGMSTADNLRKELKYLEDIVRKFEDEMNRYKDSEDGQMATDLDEDHHVEGFDEYMGNTGSRLHYGIWDKIKERAEAWAGRMREGRREEEEEGEDSEEEKEDLDYVSFTQYMTTHILTHCRPKRPSI